MVFKKISFKNRYVELKTSPLHGETILNFHFDYLTPRLNPLHHITKNEHFLKNFSWGPMWVAKNEQSTFSSKEIRKKYQRNPIFWWKGLSVCLLCLILPNWAPEVRSETLRNPKWTHLNCTKAQRSNLGQASQRPAIAQWWRWWQY